MKINSEGLYAENEVEFTTMTEAWAFCQEKGGMGNYVLLYHTLRKRYLVRTFGSQLPKFGEKIDFIAFFTSVNNSDLA